MDLYRRHQYSYIALFEPFQSPTEIENYRMKLGMSNARVNSSSKIWIFQDSYWEKKNVQILFSR